MRIPLLVLLLLPLAEIAGFVLVGQALGVLATLALIILSAVVGMALIRRQGLGVIRRVQMSRTDDREAAREVIDGTMIAIAGLLLIIPGFLTDIIGLVLFLPPVRSLAWSYLRARMTVVSSENMEFRARSYRDPQPGKGSGANVIDLDDDEYEAERRRPEDGPKSPWIGREPPR